jgi:prefoldin subunit 5
METPRTLDQINAEYRELCAQAGHMNYQIHILEGELSVINHKLELLNKEAKDLTQEKKNVEQSS